jgi:Sister chromatid cohesion protein Dcc1
MPTRRPPPALPDIMAATYLHKTLELLLMYPVSLSQPHNAASVLKLSRSLESEYEVRQEVTLQVMRWFGQVDDVDERWKMDFEKVVRQVGLGILRQYRASFELFFSLPQTTPLLILTFVSGTLVAE